MTDGPIIRKPASTAHELTAEESRRFNQGEDLELRASGRETSVAVQPVSPISNRDSARGAESTGTAVAVAVARTPDESLMSPLFSGAEAGDLRSRWENIQGGFIDEPRRSVAEANRLVEETIQRLTDGFANERRKVEQQWAVGDQVSTEDLRLALRRYRSFFERLLCV